MVSFDTVDVEDGGGPNSLLVAGSVSIYHDTSGEVLAVPFDGFLFGGRNSEFVGAGEGGVKPCWGDPFDIAGVERAGSGKAV